MGGFKVLDQYGPNITRTGKCIEDLDESDMNACGYNKSKGNNYCYQVNFLTVERGSLCIFDCELANAVQEITFSAG